MLGEPPMNEAERMFFHYVNKKWFNTAIAREVFTYTVACAKKEFKNKSMIIHPFDSFQYFASNPLTAITTLYSWISMMYFNYPEKTIQIIQQCIRATCKNLESSDSDSDDYYSSSSDSNANTQDDDTDNDTDTDPFDTDNEDDLPSANQNLAYGDTYPVLDYAEYKNM